MINIQDYISRFKEQYPQAPEPLNLLPQLSDFVQHEITQLDAIYEVKDNIAIHPTAVIEHNVTIKAPAIIGPGCFIGANAYLRQGVILTEQVSIGTGCELKSSIIGSRTAIAHFNFIGDSLIGAQVNFEAGSHTANHFNERSDKRIFININGDINDSGLLKFGAIVGDHCRIGANAVLSPGTILAPRTIVKRLELVEQVSEDTLINNKHYHKSRAQMIRNYVEGYNQYDIDQMMTDFDPNIVFENIQNGERKMRLVGLHTFRVQAEEAKQYFKERKQTIVSFKDSGNETEIEIDYYAIIGADLPNGMKSGQELRLKGWSVFTFEGEKITRLVDIS